MEEPRQTSALETIILLLSLAVKLFCLRVYILRVVAPPSLLKPTTKPPSLQVLTALILIIPP